MSFAPDDSDPEETLDTREWVALDETVKGWLAELELVRNPPFARYRLRELGEWEDYRTRFRFDTEAFAIGP